jgi:hypothetical protein
METVVGKDMFAPVIGKGTGLRKMEYTWRDVALYALGVGAHKEDLIYTWEKGNMKALPGFGLVPYLNNILVSPRKHVPFTPATIVDDLIIEKLEGKVPNRLHMAMELIMHNPIDPMQGTFLCDDKVENVYDRGEGKGVAIQTQMDIYNVAGVPVCTAKSTHAVMAFGGFGGEKLPSRTLSFPDREPDYKITDHISETQAILYRLMGDTYDVHVDIGLAKSYGYEGPFLQGLCTYGFACRMGIQAIIPGEPERLTRIYAQMRSVCYPGQDVIFVGWKVDKKIYFRLLNSEGTALLDNGVFEYQ